MPPAYPFAPTITQGQFIARATSSHYGCQLLTKTTETLGQPVVIRFLHRTVRTAEFECPLELEDHQMLNPTVLRSYCVKLGIDAKDFGFDIY